MLERPTPARPTRASLIQGRRMPARRRTLVLSLTPDNRATPA
jgi:hypothetical protein